MAELPGPTGPIEYQRDELGYARPAEAALAPIELAVWLREFGSFVSPELTAAKIVLVVDAAEPVRIPTDANQLRQIMLNLVRNAEEAFEAEAGQITLALHRERATLHGKVTETAVLTVSDNGPGIPATVQARLFDPFFTTKATGTGLGLSIVARLVENLHGEISFQSAPGSGTRFAVRLPVHGEARQTVET